MTTPAGALGRLAGTLARWAIHALTLGVCVALLALAYPSLLSQSTTTDAGALSETHSTVSARGLASAAGSLYSGADTDVVVTPISSTNDEVPVSTPPASVLPLAADGYLFKSPLLQTIIPKRPRKELVIYTVQQGDNLSTIAEKYEVDVDTLIWANGALEEDPDYLTLGEKLAVPPVSGVLYSWKTGDVLADVIKKYKGELRTVQELEYNSAALAASTVVSGTQLMIPGGEKAYQPRLVYIGGQAVMVNAPKGGGRFMWPTQGYISTFFGDGGHAGIDIAGPLGTPIYASDAGVVTFSGWNGGYGNCVIIDHGNGYVTLYGHFSSYYPQAGQNVRRGQAIGKMGSTGNSSGSHLHFEIRYQGGLMNPLRYLPQ